MSKIEIKVLTDVNKREEHDKVLKNLQSQGFKVKREYGGKLPSFEGFGALLEKVL